MTAPTATLQNVPTGLFRDGAFMPAASGGTFTVDDPSCGRVLATVADASAADGLQALTDADAVQRDWARSAPRARADILMRTWQSIQESRDRIAEVMTLEMGKPLRESHAEVTYGSEFFRWFAEEAVRINGRTTASPSGAGSILVEKEAVGPVLAITPWNFPLAMGARKIAPALAAGCTVIVKPAAETPLTMLLLAELLAAAGLPHGVLSVLPTTDPAGLTYPLLRDSRMRKVTFTGSTAVGRLLLQQSSERVLRTSMELGGNAPFIVFDDADVDAAVEGAMAAKMRNTGQACTAANRFHVDNSVRAEFVAKLTDRMSALRMGPGSDADSTVGPLISARQRDIVAGLVDDAVSRGAAVRIGGIVPVGDGWFYPPTVVDDVPSTARILREEVFGPVAAVTGFDGETEGVAAANATEYGLAAYFYSRDLARARRVARNLEVGMVGVNRGIVSDVAAPFGGVKESGLGRESGSEGIEEFLESKYIALA